ncbi:hypothetical protein [Planktothrix sp. FACHB-1355]|uniref:hypothetical protein n=1 Tax=Planktothrix sp. FACHB-1355 TaxID=2692854 RepID=UPI001A7E249F|nr:hypothetical protein [Planktothrix sp. FACHB-1355]
MESQVYSEISSSKILAYLHQKHPGIEKYDRLHLAQETWQQWLKALKQQASTSCAVAETGS